MGCFFAGNQVLVHYVGKHFAASDMKFGFMIGAMYVGSLVMVLVLGEVSERIGKRLGVVIAAICYSVGALFVALAGSVNMSIVAFFIFGCGTGGIEGVLFSLIGDYNGPKTGRMMNLTQAVFSVGAVLGPIIITWLIKFVNYQIVYGIMWVFMGILAVLFYISKDIDEFAKKSEIKPKGLMMFKLIKNPAMVLFMVALMVSIGCETSITYWLPNYFDKFGAIALGTYGLSIYWISSIPGRLVAALPQDEGKYLSISYLVASIGILLLLFLPTPALKLIGIVVLGITLAPVYPCISSMGAALFPKQSASAFSLMVFACGIGGAIAQPIIGAVATKSSITTVYGAIFVIMLILSLAIIFAVRLSKKNGAVTSAQAEQI
jgi:fucose permease